MRIIFRSYLTNPGKLIGKIIILPHIELSRDEITVRGWRGEEKTLKLF